MESYFDGLCTLATNGVDRPVLSVFRMAGMMGGNRLAVESDAGLGIEIARAEHQPIALIGLFHVGIAISENRSALVGSSFRESMSS